MNEMGPRISPVKESGDEVSRMPNASIASRVYLHTFTDSAHSK